jgi:membrane-associated protease RseP (regulator of RpoE activity)
VKALKNIGKRLDIGKYASIYLVLAGLVAVLVLIAAVEPKLRKHEGWLGIAVQRDAAGALRVTGVAVGSPAEDVGIKPGDAILSYNGVDVYEVNALKNMIEESYLNQLSRLMIERKGRKLVADTRVCPRPAGVKIPPPVLSIPQGARPPHEDRGLCVQCHNIIPPV